MRHRGVRHAGRIAWSVLGILGLVTLLGFLLGYFALVFVPLVIALFPATLLVPVSRRLERWKVPRTLAAFLTLLGGITLFGGVAAGAMTLVVSGAPELAESAEEGIEGIEETVERVVPGFRLPGRDALVDALRNSLMNSSGESGEQAGDEGSEGASSDEGGAAEGADPPGAGLGGAGALASTALSFTRGTAQAISGILLTLVILFFYLRYGNSLADGTVGFWFPGHRERIMEVLEEAWDTLGGYFRGQLLVALFDSILIGIALLVLGVPLALPLAVLIFFGGLFPILGAVVTGLLAALVAFAHGGLGLGLGVAGIALLVQQIEGNVVSPLILSKAIDLQPLTVILAITAGAIVLGVLGAFLAVPAAAIAKQVVEDVREGRTSEVEVVGG